MTLIEPSVVYKSAHHGTAASELWREHHKQFFAFIHTKLPMAAEIIEVGGAAGDLAGLLKDHVVSYTILDMEKHDDMLTGINFVQGNCETHCFSETQTLILSHVFEHLYKPLDFLKNLRDCKVQSVFLANPVMQVDSEVLPVDIEHTYFADDLDVEGMFAHSGYILREKNFFREHAFFMHFQFVGDFQFSRVLRPGRADILVASFEKRKRMLTGIDLVEASYVVPAGQFGQMVYYFTKSQNIIAFLDNDLNKQERRVYGTPYLAKSFECIREVKSPRVIIYVRHYASEIIAQLKSINPGVLITEVV